MRAPLSFAAAKRLLQVAGEVDQRSPMVAESVAQTALLGTADHREGLAAARAPAAEVPGRLMAMLVELDAA